MDDVKISLQPKARRGMVIKTNRKIWFIFTLLLQLPVIALCQSRTASWGEISRYDALVVTNDEEHSAVSWFLMASIGHSVNGEKRIYIALQKYISGNPVSFCEDKEPIYAKINEQTIRFNSYCRDYEKDGKTYKETYMTPLSNRGDEYLYNSFRKSRDHVTFELGGIYTPISSVGFSKAWEDFGGDAL